jgi:cytochrome c-type biogenesis protein CcmF
VIVELGLLALVLGMLLALAQAGFGLAGAATRRVAFIGASRSAVAGQLVFVAGAFACLTWAFLENDFSVLYVASNSNSELPTFYRIAAVWGAHEGSLLLWLLVLALWSVAVSVFGRSVPDRFVARVLGVLGLVSFGFALFVLATSNPFERLLPAAVDGRDLNPLLQDPALVIHPPMLYTGYVGFAVPFAFAVAAMLEGKLDAAWARWARPWTTLAWMFLTFGIALGSWWAYYELGWGGWWFWDPVENASFMPWLAGTALIHSLAVTEKRGLFRSWTLLLAISAFSLSLLGTFLVRSGILVSVHAFASDPSRGIFILAFLVVVIGGSLALYAWRAPLFRSTSGFGIVSRESFLLMNNALLMVSCGLILIGTLYPLFLDALELGKISVGPPYFNAVFLIPALPLVLLLGLGMHASWKKARFEGLRRTLIALGIGAAMLAVLVPLLAYGHASVLSFAGFAAGFWVIASSLIEPVARLRRGQKLSAGMLGMCIAHLGVGVFVLGVTGVEANRIEKDLSLRPGESAQIDAYEFRFVGTRDVAGPNYEAVEGEFVVTRDGEQVTVLHPQKRVYRVQRNPMTEAGIDGHWNRDLFVALGEPLGDDAWSMRLQYKPMVRFIWFGALIIGLGGLTGIFDRRYRARATEPVRDRLASDTATAG